LNYKHYGEIKMMIKDMDLDTLRAVIQDVQLVLDCLDDLDYVESIVAETGLQRDTAARVLKSLNVFEQLGA